MPTGRSGSIHLFRFSGIDVFLHWSWFLIAVYEIQGGRRTYSSIGWNIAEYLSLFAIVTIHEFGHALACRQVGGRANRIVLWPMGGVAFVDPPPRPGATLWSIAAGPLVNLVLIPIFSLIEELGLSAGLLSSHTDVYRLILMVGKINRWLLIFNILPIYPLDGGQILRSLLWFVVGRARSLMISTVLGLIGVAGFIGIALYKGSVWFGALAFFVLLNCWAGFQHARVLLRLAKAPRRSGFVCPSCKNLPPIGPFWRCGRCEESFDTFESRAQCPACLTQYPTTSCPDCGRQSPVGEWTTAAYSAPTVEASTSAFPK